MQLTRQSPAKLNLFLHVTGRRENGYHDLQTVFQFLDYGDTLCFECLESPEIVLASPLEGVEPTDDLVFKAAQILQQTTQYQNLKLQPGACIDVVKRLPMGGGLGGGSSNAATTLVALNELWSLGMERSELCLLGASLGADVPVFVHGRACWAEGIGDQLIDMELEEPWYVVLCPNVSVSTAGMFQALELTLHRSPITIRDFLDGRAENVFQSLVVKHYPLVGKVLGFLASQLDSLGLEKEVDTARTPASTGPALTGTGASVFLACRNREEATAILEASRDQLSGQCDGFVAQGNNLSSLYQ